MWCEPGCTCTSPRYEVRPPPRATDLLMIELEVCGAACTIFAPTSWCWPSPANAMDNVSPRAWSPTIQTAGYFIVTFDPLLPSTHSIVGPSCAIARLGTWLVTVLDQFLMVL